MTTNRRACLLLGFLALVAGCDMPTLQPPPKPAAPAVAKPTLYGAAGTGDLAQVEALVAAGADVNEADGEGLTALHAASFGGHAEVIRFLLAQGARVDARDVYGFTPLHAASRDGRLEAVQALVEGGADVNAKDTEGFTPYEIAEFMQHAAIAEYLAAHGAAREAPAVEAVEAVPEPSLVLTGANFRAWTSVSGSQLDAEFVQTVFDTVILRKRDGNLVRINLSLLKPEDQVLARKLAGAIPTAPLRPRPSAGAEDAHKDSIGLRIGKQAGWTVLTDCTLLHSSANDGDSFHVRQAGKEYIFRLYYVDTAETSMAYPDRVKDQADYFHLSTQDTLRLGDEAKKFTASLLSGGPFTVVTRWEDARGNSRLPRNYAFVITRQGDLDELLMAQGLVRLYGMRIDGGLGSTKYSVLHRLESSAKQAHAGAWGVEKAGATTP